jgi:hypothetical protein
MIKLKKNISVKDYRRIYNMLPAGQRKNVELMFNAFLRLNVPVDEVVIFDKGEKYEMILLQNRKLVIDINSPGLISKYDKTDQLNNSFERKDFEDLLFASTDKRIEFEKQIASIAELDNVSLVEFNNYINNRKLDSFHLLNDCINSKAYLEKGFIQRGDVILNRNIAMDLLNYKEMDVYDDNEHEFYGVYNSRYVDDNDENFPVFCVYSHKRSLESTAVGKNGNVIREIVPPGYSDFRNERRFIFESINWADIDIPVINDHRFKKNSVWKDEEYCLLFFHGLYHLDLNESRKEGLLVWRLDKKSVKVKSDWVKL